MYTKSITHFGTKGMHWGVRLGPPYPLNEQARGIKKLSKELSRLRYKEFTKLMSAKEVIDEGAGSCHDQVMYTVDKLRSLGLEPEVHFFIESDDKNHGGMTHSFVSCVFNDRVLWIENAWASQAGIHAYKTREEMLNDVSSKWESNDSFPYLYNGIADLSKWKPGADLQDLLDSVTWN